MSFGPCNNCCDIGNCDPPEIRQYFFSCTNAKTSTVAAQANRDPPPATIDALRSGDWGTVRDDTWECGTSYTPHDNCDDAAEWSAGSLVTGAELWILGGMTSGHDGCPGGTLAIVPGSSTSRTSSLGALPSTDQWILPAHVGRSARIVQDTFVSQLNPNFQWGIETTGEIMYAVLVLLQPVAATKTMQSDCGVHKIRWHYRQSIDDDGVIPAQYIDNFSRDTFASTSTHHCTTDTITNSSIQFRRGSVSDPNPWEDAIQEWLDGVGGSDGFATPATNNSTATFDATGITGVSVGAKDYIYQIIVPGADCYTSNPLDAFPGNPTYDAAFQYKMADPYRSLSVYKVQYLDASDALLWEEEIFTV